MSNTAEVTKKQSLKYIMDFDTGEQIDIDLFIRRETRLVIQDRNKMRHRYKTDQNQPWLVCSLCGAAVLLVSCTDRTFYFRHMPEEEDRDCPVNTKGQFSADEINAMKYNGAKESPAHQHLKEILRYSIMADPRFEAPPKVERVWRGMIDRKTWRKPDVQATWKDCRLAFEIQLSTTFLSIIVDRREFYRTENGYLLWLFQKFDPNRTRRAEEDIFFNNNSNVFIVDQYTLRKSIESSRLTLECWYAFPKLRHGQIYDEWQREEVSIDDLTFDQTKQRVYFVDYEAERVKLEQSLIDEQIKLEQRLIDKQYSDARDAFVNFWQEHGGKSSKAGHQHWEDLRTIFKSYGLELPEFYDSTPFNGVISIMLSAKHGHPIGYRYQKLIEVTNVAFNSYKNYLMLFGWALKVYGRMELLDSQDTKGTWSRRRTIIRDAMAAEEASYARKMEYDELIFFLLPELPKKLKIA